VLGRGWLGVEGGSRAVSIAVSVSRCSVVEQFRSPAKPVALSATGRASAAVFPGQPKGVCGIARVVGGEGGLLLRRRWRAGLWMILGGQK
jgi:hypothetical protein